MDIDVGRLGFARRTPDSSSRYGRIRDMSMRLAAPLSAEDQVVQSMPDASPTKWHLAHTTWFFETFILSPAGVAPFDPAYGYLFNSYYNAIGDRHPRTQRGLLTRPSCAEIARYRHHVDDAMVRLLGAGALDTGPSGLLALGMAHEEQHQELILTDILHAFSQNALKPAYGDVAPDRAVRTDTTLGFVAFEGGIVELGHTGSDFTFDHEGPRHDVLLRPYELADRLATNAEWLAFMQDGGYRRPELWLADGWARVVQESWTAPHYWERTDGRDDQWSVFTLNGMQPLRADAPVAHISLYEADAFARWSGSRLPTEAEWENAARGLAVDGNFLETGQFGPKPAVAEPGLRQMFGDVWEWTASAYSPYPGFRPAVGAVGEYNGKFMINQMVLRGGSCVTPRDHVRATYRNFFAPHQRWQFTGVRLAKDAG